jgi:class 3 adenylate cyclase/tetratricopeptide (TPR) repeat protein
MDTVHCPSCGEENPARFRLCGYCGSSLAPIPDTIVCGGCGEENPSKFRLCGFCGTPLAAGTPGRAAAEPGPAGGPGGPAGAPPQPASPPSQASAGASGVSLSGPAAGDALPMGAFLAPAPARPATTTPVLPAQEVRKFVTLVFTDLKDSTALTGSIDAEAMNEIKARYFSSMAVEIERHGGKVEKNIGDAIMAVFGLIRAHEDDALRAVRAAFGMQKVLARLNEDLQRFYGVQITNRTGVNTGEIVANMDPTADQNLATGDAVNVTARLEQNAPAGEILIGEVTYQLVRNHVEVERVELTLKGKPEPVPAYRLIDVRAIAPAESPASAAPFVGRVAEMGLLDDAFRAVAAGRLARLVTVIGDAGVGKTRLISDFIASVEAEATVFRGRCLAYGDGITFWPLVEIVRSAARIGEDDSAEVARERIATLLPADEPDRDAIVDRVAAAIGLSTSAHPVAELFWGVRKLLEAQAATRPVVILIDDIHSAEATFVNFLEHVVDSVRDAPILLLCSARPEVEDVHGEWLASPTVGRIDLAPLRPADVEMMIEQLLAGVELADETRAKVIAAAEGNPLYIEQIVTMLRERDPGGDVVVPPTIAALLAARLDALTRQERTIVDPAAVIGLVFPAAAIAELVPDAIRSAVDDHLTALDRKQFVHPLAADAEDPAFRFHHILVRDAAYQSLLKRARATLHERFVDWAEPVNRERGRETEFEEILGYHLEQAVRYRSELGPLDDQGRSIAERAAAKLGSAGRRAFSRGDLPAAANLLRRASMLVEPGSASRVQILLDLGSVLLENGDFGGSLAAIEEASAAAEQLGEERLVRHAAVARSIHTHLGTEVLGQAAEAIAATEEHIAWFEAADDDVGLTLAWRLLAAIHGTAGRYTEARVAIQGVIVAARKTGDGRAAARGSIAYAVLSLHGDTPVADAIHECEALARDVAGERMAEAVIGLIRGLLLAMVGRSEEATRLATESRRVLVDLGPSVTASTTSIETSRIAFLGGDPAAADRALSRDLVELEAIGERYFRSTIAGLHSRARLALGDVDGAAASAALTRSLADPDDNEAQILWRQAEANVLLARGRGTEAEALAREAVELTTGTVDLVLRADALADLAAILAGIGRGNEAGPPLQEALDLYRRKGASVAADATLAAIAAVAVAG